ncbi:pre-B-cell leukemia transcription factor-interacting protein 1 [Gambusia affinis]|uniref:pre-B-cell leukemia transcription factor-interacting protein 1 n=1 Tax=Gambusia affinis TaxID=33528 RepID=UPI001CDD0550|nr:pre-B-cell leukemia transcription factor-interacting protein 1 [Gambusia affinis]XP_043993494.1 pre-B-cell leukemia transcription factor-interacting protein 1 [Gambusia affinis]XP_043993495.1 pre-B-cell leukemia transcription factor-interacting protein 1 [Gambusia affinis]XP_043993496.1 pre-B-cell leukemia transcription factor-interacting protein 1 [Gambusia affinis]
MSDSSNSTGSTGSSTNSWTLLSPEEAAIENVGPADDGTESLGDAPSLSEEVAGAAVEEKPAEFPVETILSEEGHQVCQETSPESGEGPIPSSPSRLSPLPSNPLDTSYIDTESQPPVIHDIVTTSPSDNEPQGAMPLVGSIDLAAQLEIPAVDILLADPTESPPHVTDASAAAEAALHTPTDSEPTHASAVAGSDVWSSEPEVNVPTETLTAAEPPPRVEAEVSFAAEPPSPVPERLETGGSPEPETVGSAEAEGDVADAEKEEEMPSESQKVDKEEEEDQSSSMEMGEVNGFDDGLRRRNVPSFEAPRPRTSDEEDEEEEVEFKMAAKKEDKPWFSMNKCIVGALVLLFLGSLFLSGDIDSPELTDNDKVKDQMQDWLCSDPQDMKGLLDEMTEQITHLETKIQLRKEQLDLKMQAMAESDNEEDGAALDETKLQLEEELATLPMLSTELESLRARVNEYNQLAGMASSAPTSSSESDAEDAQGSQTAAGPERKQDTKLEKELHCLKDLLEDIKKRLGGTRKDEGNGKQVWENVDGIQKQLSKKVESWEKAKPHGPKWKGKKEKKQERDHWKKEEKKDKEWKHSKEEKKEKENSHKESWRKHQDEWQRRKGERRMDREERRKEKPWHSRPGKSSHQPGKSSHQPHHHQHHHNDFWRDQELKLHRNVRPQLGCSSLEDCASREGLYPVELAEFEELLEGYLSKLEGSSNESKDKLRKVTADFFEDGVFIHDRVRFGDFAEDVADVLEDMVDVVEGSYSLEEEMEEFEREALWKFAATA